MLVARQKHGEKKLVSELFPLIKSWHGSPQTARNNVVSSAIREPDSLMYRTGKECSGSGVCQIEGDAFLPWFITDLASIWDNSKHISRPLLCLQLPLSYHITLRSKTITLRVEAPFSVTL